MPGPPPQGRNADDLSQEFVNSLTTQQRELLALVGRVGVVQAAQDTRTTDDLIAQQHARKAIVDNIPRNRNSVLFVAPEEQKTFMQMLSSEGKLRRCDLLNHVTGILVSFIMLNRLPVYFSDGFWAHELIRPELLEQLIQMQGDHDETEQQDPPALPVVDPVATPQQAQAAADAMDAMLRQTGTTPVVAQPGDMIAMDPATGRADVIRAEDIQAARRRPDVRRDAHLQPSRRRTPEEVEEDQRARRRANTLAFRANMLPFMERERGIIDRAARAPDIDTSDPQALMTESRLARIVNGVDLDDAAVRVRRQLQESRTQSEYEMILQRERLRIRSALSEPVASTIPPAMEPDPLVDLQHRIQQNISEAERARELEERRDRVLDRWRTANPGPRRDIP